MGEDTTYIPQLLTKYVDSNISRLWLGIDTFYSASKSAYLGRLHSPLKKETIVNIINSQRRVTSNSEPAPLVNVVRCQT